jgi:predicted DNA-binding mobile mystery protein A
MHSADLKLRQLDGGRPLLTAIPVPPRGGWIKAIRAAIGMTTRQLAVRLGLAQSTVVDAEKNEAAGTITLSQLKRFAAALDCELRYVLVPRIPLAERVDAQAERKALEQVANVAHTMALEAQGTDREFQRRQIAEVKDELLRGRRSRLWE